MISPHNSPTCSFILDRILSFAFRIGPNYGTLDMTCPSQPSYNKPLEASAKLSKNDLYSSPNIFTDFETMLHAYALPRDGTASSHQCPK